MSHWIASYLLYSDEEDSDFITDISRGSGYAQPIYDCLGERAASENCGCSGCGGTIEFTKAEITVALRKSKTKKMGADREIIEFFLVTLHAMQDNKQNTVTIRFS